MKCKVAREHCTTEVVVVSCLRSPRVAGKPVGRRLMWGAKALTREGTMERKVAVANCEFGGQCGAAEEVAGGVGGTPAVQA